MKELALFGGEKAVKKTLEEISLPLVLPKAKTTVSELLDKGEISLSPVVAEFENKFKEYIGCEYGICTVNGTSAIQSALFAVGCGAGDEVIVPSFTFWATVGPVVSCNAVPVFADCDVNTHNLTAETIEKCITDKTKAILVVHVWGNPCDMDPILALAKKHNLKVVEDCSHAHGATYNGKKVGSLGDIGCFSLQGSKLLPAGEGGILVTNNCEYYERVVAYAHYNKIRSLREDSPYRKYALTGLGFKHRIHPVAAAIADAQLDELDKYNKIRKENTEYFLDMISDIDFIKIQTVPEKGERVYGYLYGAYDKEKFGGLSMYTLLKALSDEGVSCGSCSYGELHKAPVYTEGALSPVHSFACPSYGRKYKTPEYLPASEYLRETAIMLGPRFELATKEDMEQYSEAYHKVAGSLDKLIAYEAEKELKDKQVENTGRSISYFKG